MRSNVWLSAILSLQQVWSYISYSPTEVDKRCAVTNVLTRKMIKKEGYIYPIGNIARLLEWYGTFELRCGEVKRTEALRCYWIHLKKISIEDVVDNQPVCDQIRQVLEPSSGK